MLAKIARVILFIFELLFGILKSVLKLLHINIDIGDERVEKHPKLDRFYQKGVGARLLLFLVSFMVFVISVGAEFILYYAVFSGELIMLILLIPLALILNFPVNFCLDLCSIGFYHFKSGVNRVLTDVKTKIEDSIEELEKKDEEDQVDGGVETGKVVDATENKESVESIDKPKTRSIPSLIFCILEGLFTIAIPLGLLVIPFMWSSFGLT